MGFWGSEMGGDCCRQAGNMDLVWMCPGPKPNRANVARESSRAKWKSGGVGWGFGDATTRARVLGTPNCLGK